MEIRIVIRTTQPLTGTARAGHDAPLAFEGWLELLTALSTLVGERRGAAGESPAREEGL